MEKFLEPGRPQMTIRRISIACWISQYVILITFPLQPWLNERALKPKITGVHNEEANSSLVNYEISYIFGSMKMHKRAPLFSILGPMNPVRTLTI